MEKHIHVLDPDRHRWFLEQERRDPLRNELFGPGDQVVVCDLCEVAYLPSTWDLRACSCGGRETLSDLERLRVLKSERKPVEGGARSGSAFDDRIKSPFQTEPLTGPQSRAFPDSRFAAPTHRGHSSPPGLSRLRLGRMAWVAFFLVALGFAMAQILPKKAQDKTGAPGNGNTPSPQIASGNSSSLPAAISQPSDPNNPIGTPPVLPPIPVRKPNPKEQGVETPPLLLAHKAPVEVAVRFLLSDHSFSSSSSQFPQSDIGQLTLDLTLLKQPSIRMDSRVGIKWILPSRIELTHPGDQYFFLGELNELVQPSGVRVPVDSRQLGRHQIEVWLNEGGTTKWERLSQHWIEIVL